MVGGLVGDADPVLAQSDRHLAGVLAGRIFSIETHAGVAVVVFAALLPDRAKFVCGYLAAALLAANEWALRPSWPRHARKAPRWA